MHVVPARAAICLGILGIGLSAQQRPTIQVPVRLVTVPTLVLSKNGKPLPTLELKDFRLYDDGREQNIKLDTESAPLSVALAVQINREVREYLPFIAKVGSVVDNLLLGERGQAAVLTYNEDVTLVKSFGTGEVRSALQRISADGEKSRMIDAGVRAIELLKAEQGSRSRVLLFIGQPADAGSTGNLAALEEQAELENVSIYALALPEIGKTFVSDTFRLNGYGNQWYKGGYVASVELTKLIPVLSRTAKAKSGEDPFTLLTAATGGLQLHFRKQTQLEEALADIGTELRSLYTLSYAPGSDRPGYHRISVEIDVPDVVVHARPGYRHP